MGEGGSSPELMKASWGRHDLSKACIVKWALLDGKRKSREGMLQAGGNYKLMKSSLVVVC